MSVSRGDVGHHMTTKTSDASLKALGQIGLLLVPMLYTLSITLSKGAILCFFLRIFKLGPARIITYLTAAAIIIHGLIAILFMLLQCQPISLLWAPSHEDCSVDINAVFRGNAIPNVATDVVMLLLPIREVWKLRTSIQIKVGITFTFLVATA